MAKETIAENDNSEQATKLDLSDLYGHDNTNNKKRLNKLMPLMA